jgi:hypothetical protein
MTPLATGGRPVAKVQHRPLGSVSPRRVKGAVCRVALNVDPKTSAIY